ncbi:MAG: protein kinase, partial [Gemmatimonadota bacterium]
DIKPENILLSDGHAVLADFGIARAIGAAGGERLTQSGYAVGTPAYMSPEQASGEYELDGRSDIYSLACVLYEMLAGEPPFTGRTAQAVIARHVSEHPPSLRVVRPEVPLWLERIVHTSLAKVAADRYPTVEAFSGAIATHAEPRFGLRGPLFTSRRRKIIFGLALTAAVAVVLMVGRALELRVERGREPPITATAMFDPAHIAVLHFEDHSEGQQLGPLCAGFTKKLIHELSLVEALDVISFNGIKQYRNANVTLDSIARALNVGSAVEASIAESRDRLRVTVQLSDASTARLLDSTELERPFGELFALQDDVAREVSRFLRRLLGTEIRLRQRMAETPSVGAYTLVQDAEAVREEYRPLVRSGDTEGAAAVLQRAHHLLAQAEALDPLWVEPIVLRGWIARQMGSLLSEVPGDYEEDWLRQGLTHASRALSREPENPQALELRGTLRYNLHSEVSEPEAADLLDGAEEDLRAAVAANPKQATAWSTLSRLLHLGKGDFAEAKLAALRAYEEDEFLEDANDIILRLCNISLDLGEYEDALYWALEGEHRFPDRVDFRSAELMLFTMSEGPEPDVERAWQLLDEMKALMPAQRSDFFLRSAKLQVAAVLARAGLNDSARALIQQAHAGASDKALAWLAYDEANTWLLLGDSDRALEALTLFLEHEPQNKAYVAEDPWFRELRDDPRFKELVGTAE